MIDPFELHVVPISDMRGEDGDDTELLHHMLTEARQFLLAFDWCFSIREEYFGFGVGGVVAVFLMRIGAPQNVDEWLWVVNGDLPSAYLVVDNASCPMLALSCYCKLMNQWIDAVHGKGDIKDVFPIHVLPTQENAFLLEKRVQFLRSQILLTSGIDL